MLFNFKQTPFITTIIEFIIRLVRHSTDLGEAWKSTMQGRQKLFLCVGQNHPKKVLIVCVKTVSGVTLTFVTGLSFFWLQTSG